MALDFRGKFGVIVSEKLDFKWQAGVYNDFRIINGAKSGAILINGIKARQRRGFIRVDSWDNTEDEAKRWGARNATSTGPFFFADPIDKYRSKHIRAQIDFNSSTWYAKTGCHYAPGATSDQVLFHEVVHALRQVGGDAKNTKLGGGLAGYENVEEFMAVLLANIYMSDKTNQRGPQKVIRQDHIGNNAQNPAFSTSFDFFSSSQQVFKLVKLFCDQHPNWSQDLTGVDADFNPVAAYLRDPKKCEALSKASRFT